MKKVITTIMVSLLVVMTVDRSYSAEEEFVCMGIEGGATAPASVPESGTIKPIVIYATGPIPTPSADTYNGNLANWYVNIFDSSFHIDRNIPSYIGKVSFDSLKFSDIGVFPTNGKPYVHPTIDPIIISGPDSGKISWWSQKFDDFLTGILDSADQEIDFSLYDLDGDNVVDYLFFNIVFYEGGNEGTVLSLSTDYLTKDTSSTGETIRINTNHGMAQKVWTDNSTSFRNAAIGVMLHELGHRIGVIGDRGFPDLDHGSGEDHHSVGDFGVMVNNAGFNGRTSPFNPWLRSGQVTIASGLKYGVNWTSPIDINSIGDQTDRLIQPYNDTGEIYKLAPTTDPVDAYPGQYFLLTRHDVQENNYWQSKWPIKEDNALVIWHANEKGVGVQQKERKIIDVEAAYGLTEWIIDDINSIWIDTGVKNSETGLDTLDIKKLPLNQGGKNRGSRAYFFEESGNTRFSINSNPNSALYNKTGSPYPQNMPSGVIIEDIKTVAGEIYADLSIIPTTTGTISTATTWTSDVVLYGDLNLSGENIVSSGVTMWITPGATLSFVNGARLTIKGQLIAEGTALNNIVFKSENISPQPNDWKAVYFDFTAGLESPSSIKYAVIQDANNGVFAKYADNLTIENSTIQNNIIGIYPWNAGISGTDTMKIISNTIKDNKRHGIYNYFSDPIIYNNTITSNDEETNYGWGIYLRSASPRIGKNTITYNLKDGVLSTSSGGTAKLYHDPITNPRGGFNTITNNTRDGVYVGNYSSNPLLILGTTSDPGENTIKNNTGYEVSNYTSYTVLAECNEWGTGSTFTGSVDRVPEMGDLGCPQQQASLGFDWLYAALDIYPSQLGAQSDVVANANREATSLFTSGEYTDALNKFRSVIQDHSNSDGIYHALTLARESYRELDRKADSRSYLTGLAHQAANTKVKRFAMQLLMHDLEGTRNFDEALALGEEILTDNPSDSEVKEILFRQGMIYTGGLNDPISAAEKFGEIIRRYPDSEDAFFASEQLEYLVWDGLGKGAFGGKSDKSAIPKKYSLSNNYPNPFNPETQIDFALPEDGFTRLVIYDLRGREVVRLIDKNLNAGYGTAVWNASRISSGIYFYRLTSGDFVTTKKMVLLK